MYWIDWKICLFCVCQTKLKTKCDVDLSMITVNYLCEILVGARLFAFLSIGVQLMILSLLTVQEEILIIRFYECGHFRR